MIIEDLFSQNPYSLDSSEKKELLFTWLSRLTDVHRDNCEPYKRILDSIPQKNVQDVSDIPFLPVRLFKLQDFKSVPSNEIIKTLTSSGTTSQIVSRIYIDKNTSILQTKALVSILSSFVGKKRLPMIIADTTAVIKSRTSFSARGAGVLGLTFIGRNHFYLFDEEMNINWDGLKEFLENYGSEKKLIFGFTFMVWKYLYLTMIEQNRVLDFGDSILIHSGGWKKLTDLAVDNETFKERLREDLGISNIHNYYGMVEQVGSIFMECDYGVLHAPDFADIIVRDSISLEVLPNGETGIVQVLSLLPHSYPGHSLLTEDLGVILGEDNCSCGRKGKYFKIHGRLKAAELRGCSDTHAYDDQAVR